MSFRLIDYLPILLVFVVAAGFALTNVFISQFIGQRKHTRTKMMPYECGKDPVGSAHERFSVKFYLIAMIFILFDIEVIFLVPWAVVFKTLAGPVYGLRNFVYAEMMFFIALLAAGLVYVIKKGALDWGQTARVEAEAEAELLAEKDKRRQRAAARTAA
jgi:NADH-quinone oxidoreductase subunit A